MLDSIEKGHDMTKNFQSLGLTSELSELLHKQGIDEPTAVQSQAIPALFKGRDILAQAQTGTGKTLAFLLPSLQQIRTEVHAEQVLILAPTRELARQIADVAADLTPALDVDVLSLIGGKTIENQLQKLHRHPQVIIGTPGRLLDHCRRNSLDLSGVRRVIVDEADQMLQSGFLEDVDTLIGLTPKRRQLLFFSATVPDKIKGLAKKHMQNPLVLKILEGDTIALENIEQRIYMMTEEQKLPKLCQMLTEMNPYLAIVFCNTKERTSLLAGKLIAKASTSANSTAICPKAGATRSCATLPRPRPRFWSPPTSPPAALTSKALLTSLTSTSPTTSITTSTASAARAGPAVKACPSCLPPVPMSIGSAGLNTTSRRRSPNI